MFRPIIPASRLLLAAAALLSCTYCSHPPEEPPVIDRGCLEEPLEIALAVTDDRPCNKGGGYGIEPASKHLREDMSDCAEAVIRSEMEERNYRVTEEGAPIKIAIDQFFCEITRHKNSYNCFSELILSVKVIGCKGKTVFAKRFKGIAEKDYELSSKEEKAKAAFAATLREAVQQLATDAAFVSSVEELQPQQ